MDASQRLPYILLLVKWISVVQDHGSVSQLQTESQETEEGVLSSQKNDLSCENCHMGPYFLFNN